MKTSLSVIYEDNHLLVLDKPSGLPTVGVGPTETSLVKQAKKYLKQKYDKPGNVFLGVVSRLDSLVSGVIVLARTSKSAARLAEQFRTGKVAKRYWAIVTDQVAPDQGTLVDRLYKDELAHRIRVATGKHTAPQSARRAELRYRVIGRHGPHTLLEIELLTGRKHQIRAQLAARGWPIAGDKKYGSAQPFAAGIALHSVSLQLTHPSKNIAMTFRRMPPPAWRVSRFQIVDEAREFGPG